jgi:uncharacterized protein (DUF4415 family)
MNESKPASSFKQAADPDEKLAIDPDILAWFKARGAGWQDEINGVLAFYRDTIEHPASEPEPQKPSGPP